MTRRSKQELAITTILFAATLASRIPFRSRLLWGGDSINFARALERYSLADDQPHSPGYILYVATSRLLNFLLKDPNSTLVALSIFCAAASVAGIYLVGRSIFDRNTGLAAAMLMMFSPLVWFQGEIALSHIIELPFALTSTWLLYQMFFKRRYAVAAAVVIGVAGGFRQDVLMFMAPLWLIGSFRVGGRAMMLSWAAFAVSVLAWFAPLIYLTGGLADFFGEGGAHFNKATLQTSLFNAGLDGLLNNLQEIWWALLWLLGAASVILVLTLARALMRIHYRPDWRMVFLAASMLPALLFFIVVNFSHPGYVLIIAGPVILMVARAVVLGTGRLDRFRELRGGKVVITFLAALLVAVAGINTYLFMKANEINWQVTPEGETIASVYGNFSAGGIRVDNRRTQSIISAAHSLGTDGTFIACVPSVSLRDTRPVECRRLWYLLREYQYIELEPGLREQYLKAADSFTGFASALDNIHGTGFATGRFTRVLLLGVRPGLENDQNERDKDPNDRDFLILE